jgi:hypothetical protein
MKLTAHLPLVPKLKNAWSYTSTPPTRLHGVVLSQKHREKWHNSCDSPVDIALGYGLEDRGSRFRLPARAGYFSLHHCIHNGSGTHPASYPLGTRGSFPGVNRPGREADRLPPSSAEVKECVKLYLHFPLRLHGMVLSWKEAQRKFYFYVVT